GAGIYLPVEKEARRLQHRFDEQADRGVEREAERGPSAVVERGEIVDLCRAEGPAKRLEAEGRDELVRAARFSGRVRGHARQERGNLRRGVGGERLRGGLEVGGV